MNSRIAFKAHSKRGKKEALEAMALPLAEAIAVRLTMKARKRKAQMLQLVLRYRKDLASDKTLSQRFDVIYIKLRIIPLQ